jgi:predicted nucleic acid-binding protein
VILVDTSVWIAHLSSSRTSLDRLLDESRVACHPFVIGEIACGTLRQRDEILRSLATLPGLDIASHDEAMHLLRLRRLGGSGLGWVDVHLLASARLSHTPIWSLDKRLDQAARELGLAAELTWDR